jgi:hypothetical protein
MSRRTWARRYAFELAVMGTGLLFLLKACIGEIQDLVTPYCRSDKCPGNAVGIYLEGECWCITKPDP